MKYAFGNMCVDAGARRISSATGPVHLTRKAFDLLLLLLECRPNAVAKDQIHVRLWPDTFVAECSLQTLVHEIRQAIDDPGLGESYIRTVRGIGYSFAGDVLVSDAQMQPARFQGPAAWLVGESTRVALYSGENIVGRDYDTLIDIQAPTISRRHVCITIGESITIEDHLSR